MATYTYEERGNGYPTDGAYLVVDTDGCGDYRAFRIIECGRIETHGPGRGNTCEMVVDDIGHEISDDAIDAAIERGWCDEDELS